jgi:hypothetical protein
MEAEGYYGSDITELSKEVGVTPQRLRKQISKWKGSTKGFRNLRYLGQRPPSVTLDEFIEMEARQHSNPIEVKRHVLEDIRADRLGKRLQDLPSSTFYQVKTNEPGQKNQILSGRLILRTTEVFLTDKIVEQLIHGEFSLNF